MEIVRQRRWSDLGLGYLPGVSGSLLLFERGDLFMEGAQHFVQREILQEAQGRVEPGREMQRWHAPGLSEHPAKFFFTSRGDGIDGLDPVARLPGSLQHNETLACQLFEGVVDRTRQNTCPLLGLAQLQDELYLITGHRPSSQQPKHE